MSCSLLSKIFLQKTQSSFLPCVYWKDDIFARKLVSTDIHSDVITWQNRIRTETGEDADIILADSRYRFIQKLISESVVKSKNDSHYSNFPYR